MDLVSGVAVGLAICWVWWFWGELFGLDYLVFGFGCVGVLRVLGVLGFCGGYRFGGFDVEFWLAVVTWW